MDRQVGILLPDRSNQYRGCLWFEHASHVFDTEDMDLEVDEFVYQIHVILQVVLFLRVQHIPTVADSTFNNTTSLVYSFDTDLKLVDIVKRVENAKNVNTILFCLFNEMIDCIVRQRGICHSICATQKHLEGDIGNQFSHLSKSLPWIFVEEAHSNIKRSTAPTF